MATPVSDLRALGTVAGEPAICLLICYNESSEPELTVPQRDMPSTVLALAARLPAFLALFPFVFLVACEASDGPVEPKDEIGLVWES